MAYNEPFRHPSLLVFDIETVPDDAAVANLTGQRLDTVDARRAALEQYHLDVTDGKNGFPRQMFHKVVAISVLKADIEHNPDGTETHTIKHLSSNNSNDEGEIVAGFYKYLKQIRPRLVSFNGRGFDLPVLKYRAMSHGVAAPWYYQAGTKWDSYHSRYSADWHCDLLDVLSEYGASARVKLNEVCAVLGLPGKFGPDGSQVTTMYDAGQLDAIRNYCETDVLNTYLVYLRLMHHQGRMSTEGVNHAIAQIVHMIENSGSEKPHLAAFLEAWGEAGNNTFMLKESAA